MIQLDHDLGMFSPVIEEHCGLELVVILAGELQLADAFEDICVEASQCPVGDDQEVAAAAGGIAQPVTLDTRPQCGARPSNSFDTGYELGFLTGAIVSRLGY